MDKYKYYKKQISNYNKYGGAYDSTTLNYWKKLLELYPTTLHIYNNYKDAYNGHKLTYGEMISDELKKIYEKHKLLDYRIFMDLGSGLGKLPLYVAGFDFIIKSIGVELVDERINYAINLKKSLVDSGFQSISDKVEFIHSDLFKINYTDKVLGHKTFVWVSNLCYEEVMTINLFEKLYTELPNDSIICCSKIPGSIDPLKFVNLSIESVQMSWNSNSSIYLYKIKK